MTRAEQLRWRVWLKTRRLEPDALRVLLAVAERLWLGQQRHGVLMIDRDPRAWTRELAEELLDGLVYREIRRLRGER